MALDHQRGNQPASYEGSTGTNNEPFNSNHGTSNSHADTTMYQTNPESQYANSGAGAPYYHPERSHGPRLGLIRGYHRQMYEPIPQKGPCCAECSPEDSKGTAAPVEGCNWGVAFGCVLLVIGVIAVLMGFLVPQKPTSRHGKLTTVEKNELHQINLFVDIFVISGLSVLSIGGLLIAVALLLPLFRRKTDHRYDEPVRYFGSEVYVKAEDVPMTKSGKPSIDLGFHKDVVPADIALRKIQPEREKSEPIDLVAQTK